MKPLEPARFSTSAARRLAEEAMVEGLGPADARRLGRMLEASDQDREAYGKLKVMFGALEGSDTLTEGQHLRILAGIQQEVARPAPKRSNHKHPASWLARLGPVLAGAMALLLLVFVPRLLWENPDEAKLSGLQSRGVDSPGAPGAHPSDVIDLRAYCIRGGVLIKQRPRVTPHHPDAECLLSDRLQMMITHTAGYKHLLVIGHLRTAGGEDRMLWYYPVPPTGRSGAAPGDTEYAPLGQAVDLAVNHEPGQARILAVFSRSAMDAKRLYEWLRTVPGTDAAAELLRHRGGSQDMTVVEQRVQLTKAKGP